MSFVTIKNEADVCKIMVWVYDGQRPSTPVFDDMRMLHADLRAQIGKPVDVMGIINSYGVWNDGLVANLLLLSL